MAAPRDGNPNCRDCVRSCPTIELSALSPAQLRIVDGERNHGSHAAGATLFRQGDAANGLHCLRSGTVVTCRADGDGNETIVGMAGPGETLGYRAFFGGGRHDTTARAATDVRACFIPGSLVRALLAETPGLAVAFLERAVRELGAVEQDVLHRTATSARKRMALLLVSLRHEHGVVDDEGRLAIDLPLSRTQLAARIGVRPETVSRTIRELESAGVARFTGRRVAIPDLDALLDEVEGAA